MTRCHCRTWNAELEKPTFKSGPGFRTALVRAFAWDYIRVLPLVTLENVCMAVQPIVVRFLLGFFAQPQQVSFQGACLLAALLVLLNVTQSFCGPHIVYSICQIVYKVDNSSKGLLYKKV